MTYGLKVGLALDSRPLFVLSQAGDRDLGEVAVARQIGLEDALRRLDRVTRDARDLRHRGTGSGHAEHRRSTQVPRLRVDTRALGDAPVPLVEAEIFHRPAAVGNDGETGRRARQAVKYLCFNE